MSIVSIILPTYNREKFLTTAFESIKSQSFKNWELIIIDDGSTDNTRALVSAFQNEVTQSVIYRYQANSGAYKARAVGIAMARGELITFFDSDDLWIPNHLEHAVGCLDKYPEVDWLAVRGCHITNPTNQVDCNAQTMSPIPDALLKLESKWDADLQIFKSENLAKTLIEAGHGFGFPLSIMRKSVFEAVELKTNVRNGEDRMFLLRTIKAGFTLAVLHRMHYIFVKHAGNSSAASVDMNWSGKQRVYQAVISGYAGLLADLDLTVEETKAIKKRIAEDLFWKIGYHLHWNAGRIQEAFRFFKLAANADPRNLKLRKSMLTFYLKNSIRSFLQRRSKPKTTQINSKTNS